MERVDTKVKVEVDALFFDRRRSFSIDLMMIIGKLRKHT